MKNILFLLLTIFLSKGCFIIVYVDDHLDNGLKYQKIYEKNTNDPTDPEETESWENEPKVIDASNYPLPPSDAIILFDGKNLNEWKSSKDGNKPKWKINDDGSMSVVPGTGDIETIKKFGSIQLHLEWSAPEVIEGDGQERGNSGIFFQNRYEIQILDSYDNETYYNGQAASVYKQYPPLANATNKPSKWNTYDIIFNAPQFNEKGQKIKSGYFSVFHNGILVQNHVEILGTTEYIGWPKNLPHGPDSIKLQDHSNPVKFRNIWVRKI